MDIISLGKASKTLKEINQLNDDVIGKRAEGRFKTVDHRLDWIEGQADKTVIQNSVKIDFSQGTFDNVEFVDGRLQLKLIEIIEE